MKHAKANGNSSVVDREICVSSYDINVAARFVVCTHTHVQLFLCFLVLIVVYKTLFLLFSLLTFARNSVRGNLPSWRCVASVVRINVMSDVATPTTTTTTTTTRTVTASTYMYAARVAQAGAIALRFVPQPLPTGNLQNKNSRVCAKIFVFLTLR